MIDPYHFYENYFKTIVEAAARERLAIYYASYHDHCLHIGGEIGGAHYEVRLTQEDMEWVRSFATDNNRCGALVLLFRRAKPIQRPAPNTEARDLADLIMRERDGGQCA